MMKMVIAAMAVCALAGVATAGASGLINTIVDLDVAGSSADGSLGGSEYGNGAFAYTGGGSGFGGSVGGGTIRFDSDNTNLYIGFSNGAVGLGNLVTIFLNTRAGGHTDASMFDAADGGRRVSTNLSANVDDLFAPEFLPDFSLVFSSGFGVLFELQSNAPINFISNAGNAGDDAFREFVIPLATLGITGGLASNIDFFVAYISDTSFGSNESIPAGPINQGGNPGFDGPSAGYGNYNRFTTVPTPGALALLGMSGLVATRRRRA